MSKALFNKVSDKDIEYLEKIVGSRNVSTEEVDLITNAIDASPITFHKPEVVVWPDNAEQIVKILEYANRVRIPVYPRGGGTSNVGTVPIYGGIVVSLRKMNKICEIDEENMLVRVEPGIIYDALNKELEKFRLFFPPDPSSGAACTIGGMVASNASGCRAVKYGTTREFVLGVDAVFPMAGLVKLGSSMSAKYSHNLDLSKLMVGSQGTLAVFTEIALKLKVLPESVKTCVSIFNSTVSAIKSIYKIIRQGLDVAALEFMDKNAISGISEFENINPRSGEAILLIETEGSEKASSESIDKCIEILKNNEAVEIWLANNKDEREKLWSARKGAHRLLQQLGKYTIESDVAIPLSSLEAAVEMAYTIGKKYQLKTSCLGHFGDGNLHIVWGTNDDLYGKELLHKAIDELNKWAISIGGAVSGEHGIGTHKKQYMRIQYGGVYELLLKIKRNIDPRCILSPGIIFDVKEIIFDQK